MNQVLEAGTVPVSETTIESVLLDTDLFVKYGSPEKAAQTAPRIARTQPKVDRVTGKDARHLREAEKSQ